MGLGGENAEAQTDTDETEGVRSSHIAPADLAAIVEHGLSAFAGWAAAAS